MVSDKILRFSSKTDTFLKICKGNGGGTKKRGTRVVVVPFFYPLFFYFQPNSRATKRARPQASETRKNLYKKKTIRSKYFSTTATAPLSAIKELIYK